MNGYNRKRTSGNNKMKINEDGVKKNGGSKRITL